MGSTTASDPVVAALDALRIAIDDAAAGGEVMVAFSGGADSALLAWAAHDTLGDRRAEAVTAVSPSLAGRELDDCRRFAEKWQLRWRSVETHEMENAAYRVNDANRCWHCKDALMDALAPIAGASGATIVLGVNVDDLGDHRPGQNAAQQRGARFPFVEAGLTKQMVRAVSRHIGLDTWDKPAAACLASRLPYGMPVTLGRLRRVEDAEAALVALGFDELRVRHYDETARIEVPRHRLAEVVDHADAVCKAVKAAGFGYVTLDLEGLRSGNLNAALDL